MLRVGDLGFFWVHSPEICVEQINVIENGPCLDEIGLAPERRVSDFELLILQRRDRLHTIGEVLPELMDILGTGKPSRHANDGDSVLVFSLTHEI